MVFLVTVTVLFPKMDITNGSSSHQQTWHCVLVLALMVAENILNDYMRLQKNQSLRKRADNTGIFNY